MTNCICEQPDYEGQAKSNGGWDKGCPVHGDPEPEGDFVGIGRNGSVSPKAAEAPGGPDDARILMRELREEMLKMGWAVSTRPILRDLFQRLTEQLGTFPAPAAPSERADEILEKMRASPSANLASAEALNKQFPLASPSLSEEREKFEEWVKKDGFPDADLSQCGCADQMRFHYQDAYTDFAYRACLARAGLSSQEGK